MIVAQTLSLPVETRVMRVLIVDDEPASRRDIRRLLRQDADVAVVGEADNGEEAVELIDQLRPDLVYLDVEMPGGTGFDVVQQVGLDQMPPVIFVTAYGMHALRAFDVNPVDYLLKPYDDDRFFAALRRAKLDSRVQPDASRDPRLGRLINTMAHDENTREPGMNERIMVKSGGDIHFLKSSEVDWVEADGDYMRFHMGVKNHLMRETMTKLESRLDRKRFVRIHRSTIVNIDRVIKLCPSFLGEYIVVLADGTKLKLSKSYHDSFQAALKAAV